SATMVASGEWTCSGAQLSISRSTPSSSVAALRRDSVSSSTLACAASAVHRRSSGVETGVVTVAGPGSGAGLPVLITGEPVRYEERRELSLVCTRSRFMSHFLVLGFQGRRRIGTRSTLYYCFTQLDKDVRPGEAPCSRSAQLTPRTVKSAPRRRPARRRASGQPERIRRRASSVPADPPDERASPDRRRPPRRAR